MKIFYKTKVANKFTFLLFMTLHCWRSCEGTAIALDQVSDLVDDASSDFCFGIEPCGGNRQVLVLLDASASMNKVAVNTKIFPFLQRLSCLFDDSGKRINQIGLITFNSQIDVAIPLAAYSFDDWIRRVDEVKSRDPCCSCCTPHAEAFDAALSEFERADELNDDNIVAERVTLLITDGVPHQNYDTTAYGDKSMPHAFYKAFQVSNSAQALKVQANTRIVVINVPRRTGELADLQYFQGIFETPEQEVYCSRNAFRVAEGFGCTPGKRKCCLPVDRSTFPIVSIPTEQNIFHLSSFGGSSIIELVNKTQYTVCEVEWVPVCQVRQHELLFLIDTSRSIQQEVFRTELLDVVEALHQALSASITVSGVIAFGDGVRLAMPLSNYSISEFSDGITALREGHSTDHPGEAYCCACCTPTAEALELAANEFLRQNSGSPHRRVIIITDGAPSQLKDGSKWSKQLLSKRKYNKNVVPATAKRLRRLARVFELQVPSSFTNLKPKKKKRKRQRRQHEILHSSPAQMNYYAARIWNVAKVTANVLSKLCRNGEQFARP